MRLEIFRTLRISEMPEKDETRAYIGRKELQTTYDERIESHENLQDVKDKKSGYVATKNRISLRFAGINSHLLHEISSLAADDQLKRNINQCLEP